MSDAPREIWLDWRPGLAVTQGPLASPPRTPYIRADIAEAEKEAAVRAERDKWRPIAAASRADYIRHPCAECGGSGYRLYASTATWRGGIGGQAMTTDVCDKCWGSGDATKPWPSHAIRARGD